jgi:hydrogenase maturation factor
MTEQHNIIKRKAISITGTMAIDTSGPKQGDTIHATKEKGREGWTVLNVRTGKFYWFNSDLLRRFVIISEQITA